MATARADVFLCECAYACVRTLLRAQLRDGVLFSLSVCQCDVTVVGWLVGVVLCCLRVYSLRPHRMLQRLPTAESQCQSRERLPMDMIFTDIVGLTQFKRKVKGGYGKFRYTCELYN